MRKLHLFILAAAAILSGGPCLAATSVSAAKTKEYHDAYAAFVDNDVVKAFEILAPLVQRTHAYDATGFLGQTELSLNMYRDAAEHLYFAIQNTPPGKVQDAVPVLTQDLIQAKKHIVTLRITVDQHDADITIDGKTIGKSPLDSDIFVDTGKHTIKATHPTMGSAESAIDTKMGEERTVALQLAQAPVAGTAASSAPPPLKYTPADLDKPSSTGSPLTSPPPVESTRGVEPKTIVLIAGGAVTLIAAGSATYFGLKARGAKNDAESLLSDAQRQFGSNPCASSTGQSSQLCASVRNNWDQHNSAGRIYNVALPVAAVAAIATGVLYAFLPSRKETTSRNLTLLPVANQRTGGFVLEGDF